MAKSVLFENKEAIGIGRWNKWSTKHLDTVPLINGFIFGYRVLFHFIFSFSSTFIRWHLKTKKCRYKIFSCTKTDFRKKNAFRKSIENGRFRKCSYFKGAHFKEQFLPGDKRFLPTMYPKLKGIRETWGRLCRVKLRERNQLIIWMERVCVSIK